MSVAIIGGSADFLALWLKQAGREDWFDWYVAIICGIAFAVALYMPDARSTRHLRQEMEIQPQAR
jgi:MHS family alpha-ketoglutarate permease-like MFS transporter